jgi:hypothetical protein
MRNRRPQASASDTKSSDQRWLRSCGIVIGARVPSAFAAAAAPLQALLAIQVPELLVVDHHALAPLQPV